VRAGLIEETEKSLSDEVEALLSKEKVDLNVTNLGDNTRRVEARIAIQTPLDAVWAVLTDYDHLADHIPGLAESRVLESRPNGARLLQIGQKNLALGVKFKAKAVVEVTEEAPHILPDGTLRDLHFETVEGDFQIFKGTWRMHQKSGLETYLSYILEVRPKRWMPVALIQGVLGHEITCNLVSVRKVALKNHNSLDS
jgi:ribosome-associated toxin RatA of RatAB toxin-antitoxin module